MRVQRKILAGAAARSRQYPRLRERRLVYRLGLVMSGSHRLGAPDPDRARLRRHDDAFVGPARAAYTPRITLTAYPKQMVLEYWLSDCDMCLDPPQLWWSLYEEVAARRAFVKKAARDYICPLVAEAASDIAALGGHVAIGAHGKLDGLGAHWEMWRWGRRCRRWKPCGPGMINAGGLPRPRVGIGSLEVDQLASLAVVDSNPLEVGRQSSDVRSVRSPA